MMRRSIVLAFSALLMNAPCCFPADAETPAAPDSTAIAAPPVAEQPAPAAPSPDAVKKQGDLLARKGKSAQAIELYKQSIDLGVSDTARNRLALAVGKNCSTAKNYEEALRYFAMVSGKAAETLAFKTILGEALQLTGKNDSAIALLEPIAANQKIPVLSRKGMFKIIGDAYFENKKEDQATIWYGKHVTTGGTKTADIAYLLAIPLEKSAPPKAVLAYEANIKSYPADFRNYLRLGMLLAKSKASLERSVTLLKKAVSLADSIPSAWFEIGRTYQRMNKPDEAIDAYQNGLRLDENNLEAKLAIGTILLDKGSTDEAISFLEKAHKQAPDSIGPMVQLSAAYTRSGKPKKALELLVKLKAAQPADVAIRKQLVDAYQSSNQDQKAFEELQGLLEIERDRDALFPYAKLLAKMGKFDEAVAALEEVLGVAPDDFDALMTMASIYRQQGKLEEAVNVYKEVCTMDAKFAPALYERAEVHLEQSKVKWAEMFYQRALAADPSMALAEVGLAKLSLMFNKRDEMNLHLGKAEAMAADDPEVKKAIDAVRNPKKSAAVKPAAASQDEPAAEEETTGKKTKKKKSRKE